MATTPGTPRPGDRQHPLAEAELHPGQAARQPQREHRGDDDRQQPDEQEGGAPAGEIADQRAERRAERHREGGAADHRRDRPRAVLRPGEHHRRRLRRRREEAGGRPDDHLRRRQQRERLARRRGDEAGEEQRQRTEDHALAVAPPVSVARIGVPIA